MLQVSYNDVLAGKEIPYACCGGRPEEIKITDIPQELVLSQKLSTGSGREKIFYTIRREGSNVTVTPVFEAESLPRCMFLKDSLLLLPLDVENLLLRLRCECHPASDSYEKFMLVLDLGNTRTCAFISRTLWDPGAVQQWMDYPLSFEPLKMRLNYKNDENEYCEPIFSSKCILGAGVHQDKTRSLLQLDKNAEIKPNDDKLPRDSRYWLSGPKRYFWRHDTIRFSDNKSVPERHTSKLLYLCPDKDFSYHYEVLDTPLTRAMTHRYFRGVDEKLRQEAFREGWLPYSVFLKGMLWELMEQAELQANRNLEDNKKPFRLAELVVTFPAVWTEEERKEYERQIKETADLYAQQRCWGHETDSGINIDVSCNEGMAVLATYLYSEYNNGTINELIDKNIAIIDIGGGTSDLVIASLTASQNEEFNTQYQVKPLYSNGTYEAGDKFIFSLVNKILVPSVLKKIFPAIDNRTYVQLTERLTELVQSSSTDGEILKSLIFSLWYPIALELLKQLQDKETDSVSLDKKYEEHLDEFKRLLARISNSVSQFLIAENILVQEDEKIKLLLYTDDLNELKADFKSQMKKAIERTFSETLKNFKTVVMQYKCTRVLFSGKVSDIPLIQEVFSSIFKDISFIGMNGYEYKEMPTKDYIAKDSKYATVTGAGLYRMAKTNRLYNFDLKILAPELRKFTWGIFRDNQFQNFEKKDSTMATVTPSKKPVYLARKSSEKMPWIPSYEFRPNPLRDVTIEENIIVSFTPSAHQPESLTCAWISGSFKLDGKKYELQKGCHVSDDLQSAFDEAFEFRIRKLKPENNLDEKALEWLDTGLVFLKQE